ncbi:hypothetical protein A0H81_10280 [Grifola frondosa]|uniref:Uncharacterized protein n=1 Tax=Grifola frondosa TaxID=5627 RepID=A0A1C7LZA4_GRIFR|nr:hypothetical protein A0H81_10280 [Grifola frondosa]
MTLICGGRRSEQGGYDIDDYALKKGLNGWTLRLADAKSETLAGSIMMELIQYESREFYVLYPVRRRYWTRQFKSPCTTNTSKHK